MSGRTVPFLPKDMSSNLSPPSEIFTLNVINVKICKKTSLVLTLTAIPLRSDEPEAAVAEVLGTVLVLVSLIRMLDKGIPKLRDATYMREIQHLCLHPFWSEYQCLVLHFLRYVNWTVRQTNRQS